MSSDDEFEQFLRSADGLGAPKPDDALRVRAGLSPKVSWKRHLPAAMSSSLQTSDAAAPVPRYRFPRFVNVAAVAISVAGLSATTGTFVDTSGETAVVSTIGSNAAAPDVPPSEPQPPPDDPPPSGEPVALPTMNEPPQRPAVPSALSSVKAARGAGTLDVEVALLAETSAAIRAGRPSRALTLADQHAREFPRGVLGPEFDAQRVVALAALGRREEACALASRFLSSHPNSPLALQVRSSCYESNR
ncbi:MAG: hypothetical protein BGO98_12080 [Myxococcales bacterium 68-20]|nr:MAG: hypothetical protein BGO98_12080 [Myxococcales bacterium 68-20]